MSIWLTDLATVLRGAGLRVNELDGWRTRANSTGALRANLGIAVHHTASGTGWTGEREARFCALEASGRPIYNVLLDRTGLFWVLAAGSTNSEGRGGPWTSSRGTVPVDGGNSRLLSLAIANNGVGEPYPRAVTDALVTACAALSRRYAYNPSRDIVSHWARSNGQDPGWTNRKIDPAGPSPWTIPGDQWQRWDMQRFRGAVAAAMTGTTPTPTPPGGDDVTPADIQAIAAAVWTRALVNHSNATPQPAGDLLRFAHFEAWSTGQAVNVAPGGAQLRRFYVRCRTPSVPTANPGAVYELAAGELRHITGPEWRTIVAVNPGAAVVDVADDADLRQLPGYGTGTAALPPT